MLLTVFGPCLDPMMSPHGQKPILTASAAGNSSLEDVFSVPLLDAHDYLGSFSEGGYIPFFVSPFLCI